MPERDYYTSEYISDFLDFLNASVEQHNMALDELEEANNQLCDVEHCIELCNLNASQRATATKLMRSIQINRRNAKDNIEIFAQIAKWVEDNKATIASLQHLLGAVRKVEKTHATRHYTVRTNILKDIHPDPFI